MCVLMKRKISGLSISVYFSVSLSLALFLCLSDVRGHSEKPLSVNQEEISHQELK